MVTDLREAVATEEATEIAITVASQVISLVTAEPEEDQDQDQESKNFSTSISIYLNLSTYSRRRGGFRGGRDNFRRRDDSRDNRRRDDSRGRRDDSRDNRRRDDSRDKKRRRSSSYKKVSRFVNI